MLVWSLAFAEREGALRLCAGRSRGGRGRLQSMQLNSTTIVPPWPSPPYTLACPAGTPQATCDLLGPTDQSCFEPEWDTAEIITAILLGHPGALYVDIGCNIGAFALQAYSLGAHVRQFRSVELATTQQGYTDANAESHFPNDRSHLATTGRLLRTYGTLHPCNQAQPVFLLRAGHLVPVAFGPAVDDG